MFALVATVFGSARSLTYLSLAAAIAAVGLYVYSLQWRLETSIQETTSLQQQVIVARKVIESAAANAERWEQASKDLSTYIGELHLLKQQIENSRSALREVLLSKSQTRRPGNFPANEEEARINAGLRDLVRLLELAANNTGTREPSRTSATKPSTAATTSSSVEALRSEDTDAGELAKRR